MAFVRKVIVCMLSSVGEDVCQNRTAVMVNRGNVTLPYHRKTRLAYECENWQGNFKAESAPSFSGYNGQSACPNASL
jgi:hypothetical protein